MVEKLMRGQCLMGEIVGIVELVVNMAFQTK